MDVNSQNGSLSTPVLPEFPKGRHLYFMSKSTKAGYEESAIRGIINSYKQEEPQIDFNGTGCAAVAG